MTKPPIDPDLNAREQSLHDLLDHYFGESNLTGSALLVDSHYTGLDDHFQITHWRTKYSQGVRASLFPDDEATYDHIIIRLPKSHTYFDFILRVIGHYANPQTKIYVYGKNDEGAKGARKKLLDFYETVEVAALKDRGRILVCTKSTSSEKLDAPTIEEFASRHALCVADTELQMTYLPGMFALGELDMGSKLLLDTLLETLLETSVASEASATQVKNATAQGAAPAVLDYACGSGLLAKALPLVSPAYKDAAIDLLDYDVLSLHSARINVPNAQNYILGNSLLQCPPDTQYDLIISNPPIHTAKDEQFETLYSLIKDAPNHLAKGGSLILVAQSRIDLEDLFTQHFTHFSTLANTDRFRVWKGVVL